MGAPGDRPHRELSLSPPPLALPQMVGVLEAFIKDGISLVFDRTFEFSWLHVCQADVFHRPSSPKISDVGSRLLAHGAYPQRPVRPVSADDDA
jgi:hypothetical protein